MPEMPVNGGAATLHPGWNSCCYGAFLYDVFCASRNAAQSSPLTLISIFFSWQAFQRTYPKCDLSFNLSGITTVTNWR